MPIYRPGDRVFSRRFGRGEVASIIGVGESVQLRIRFDSGEEHEVLARSTELELLARTVSGDGQDDAAASPAAPAPEGEAEREGALLRGGFLPPRSPSPAPTPDAARGSETTPGPPVAPRRATRPVDPIVRDALAELAADLLGAAAIPPMERWVGGEMVLRPGRAGTKEKTLPLDAFFHKIVMVRDRLRTLEQKINASPSLADAEKVEMQQYLARVQGSLTTFNFLFREREDWFVGQGGQE